MWPGVPYRQYQAMPLASEQCALREKHATPLHSHERTRRR
jgi:hypothetical protein